MRDTRIPPRLRAAWTDNILLATATAGLLSLAAGVAGAQTATTPAAAPAGPLEEVVVTATRREESLSKIAVSVTAITQEGLDMRGVKDIESLARFTPGINVDNSGHQQHRDPRYRLERRCGHHRHLYRRHADPDAGAGVQPG